MKRTKKKNLESIIFILLLGLGVAVGTGVGVLFSPLGLSPFGLLNSV